MEDTEAKRLHSGSAKAGGEPWVALAQSLWEVRLCPAGFLGPFSRQQGMAES